MHPQGFPDLFEESLDFVEVARLAEALGARALGLDQPGGELLDASPRKIDRYINT